MYKNLEEYLVTRSRFEQGGLWLSGVNAYGQLGDTTTLDAHSPIQTITGGSNWKLVSGGIYHTAAIKTDGTLWLWGGNAYGQLGNNDYINLSSPVQTVSAGNNWKLVSCGEYTTAAIKTDGTLWMWGNRGHGVLGDTHAGNVSSPVQTVSAGNNWKLVSCGGYTTAAIKTDGTLWTWGSNFMGQLGDDTTSPKSSPIQTVAAGTNWKFVACGGNTVAGIKTDGTLWLWGANNDGMLGNGTTTHTSSPIQTIAGGTDWKSVSCTYNSVAAIKTDGTLWTWGSNWAGQLGDGTTTSTSSPIQTIAGGTNWKVAVVMDGRGVGAIKW